MNNLLLRELPLNATIRLWDTYLSEPDGFNKFHLYVCAAFLCRWKQDLEQRIFHTRDLKEAGTPDQESFSRSCRLTGGFLVRSQSDEKLC